MESIIKTDLLQCFHHIVVTSCDDDEMIRSFEKVKWNVGINRLKSAHINKTAIKNRLSTFLSFIHSQ